MVCLHFVAFRSSGADALIKEDRDMTKQSEKKPATRREDQFDGIFGRLYDLERQRKFFEGLFEHLSGYSRSATK
jgi:hypothetical protein